DDTRRYPRSDRPGRHPRAGPHARRQSPRRKRTRVRRRLRARPCQKEDRQDRLFFPHNTPRWFRQDGGDGGCGERGGDDGGAWTAQLPLQAPLEAGAHYLRGAVREPDSGGGN
ncbi:MAG: Intramembrane protease RasP/YluC, implicated in cell division based on FtsL cleavage, partial [uncultured Rubrobacteraceae bacterium]